MLLFLFLVNDAQFPIRVITAPPGPRHKEWTLAYQSSLGKPGYSSLRKTSRDSRPDAAAVAPRRRAVAAAAAPQPKRLVLQCWLARQLARTPVRRLTSEEEDPSAREEGLGAPALAKSAP